MSASFRIAVPVLTEVPGGHSPVSKIRPGQALLAVPSLALLILGGCATPGAVEGLKWSMICPKTVPKGSEFEMTVKTVNSAGDPVEGGDYCYQIRWTKGSSAPLRHKGRTGETTTIQARSDPGPASITVTCLNREGSEVKVLEVSIEVK